MDGFWCVFAPTKGRPWLKIGCQTPPHSSLRPPDISVALPHSSVPLPDNSLPLLCRPATPPHRQVAQSLQGTDLDEFCRALVHFKTGIRSLREGVTLFAMGPLAQTLRRLCELPGLVAWLLTTPERDRRALLAFVQSYVASLRRGLPDYGSMLRGECLPTVLSWLLRCDEQEHQFCLCLLDSLLGIARARPGQQAAHLRSMVRLRMVLSNLDRVASRVSAAATLGTGPSGSPAGSPARSGAGAGGADEGWWAGAASEGGEPASPAGDTEGGGDGVESFGGDAESIAGGGDRAGARARVPALPLAP